MATDRLMRLAALVAGAACAATLAACGGGGKDTGGSDDASNAHFVRVGEARKAAVERAIRDHRLPPAAMALIRADGTVDLSFVQDVVRSRDNGRSGPPLRFDLDGDGHISPDERRFTFEDLYKATQAVVAPATARVEASAEPDG
jgi:hypothetical protein